MTLGKQFGLVVGASLLILGSVADVARGIEVIPTDFLQEVPVQVSAYSWRLRDPNLAFHAVTNPRILNFVQLYNDSDELVDLAHWSVFVQDSTTLPMTETGVVLSSNMVGKLAPHDHVIASYGGAVGGATYTISSEVVVSNLTTSSTSKVKLIVRGQETSSYRDSEYGLKLDTNQQASFWQRTFSSTGEGYTSSFTAQVNAPVQLFDDGLYEAPPAVSLSVVEIYPYSSDCAPHATGVLCGDYIKLHVNENVYNLENYVLRTDSSSQSRTSANSFWLGAYEPNEAGFITVYLTDAQAKISLTNSGGYVWLEDLYGETIYETTMTRYESATSEHQGWSYALGESGTWQWTSTPRPNAVNTMTVPVVEPSVVTCPAGKYLNPDTNRCRTLEEAVNALAVCPEGETRNPATNRCRKNVVLASSLTPCSEGQERNILTNRCRSIASAVAELIPCDEGYERNPSTNRCRKVLGIATAAVGKNTVSQTMNTKATADTAAWGWILASVAVLGAVGYGVYEWRNEALRGLGWVRSRLTRK